MAIRSKPIGFSNRPSRIQRQRSQLNARKRCSSSSREYPPLDQLDYPTAPAEDVFGHPEARAIVFDTLTWSENMLKGFIDDLDQRLASVPGKYPRGRMAGRRRGPHPKRIQMLERQKILDEAMAPRNIGSVLLRFAIFMVGDRSEKLFERLVQVVEKWGRLCRRKEYGRKLRELGVEGIRAGLNRSAEIVARTGSTFSLKDERLPIGAFRSSFLLRTVIDNINERGRQL